MASISKYEPTRFVLDTDGNRIPHPDKPGKFLTEKTGEVTWRARYRDVEGREHSRHFRRKVDAQSWLNDVTVSKHTGTWVDPSRARTTVESMAKTWLASHPDWTESTRARNESIVHLHIIPRWGKTRLADVTAEAIQQWSAGIQLAPGSVRKIIGVLNGILDLAVTFKRLAVNPVQGVTRPRQSLTKRRYLKVIEVERLADAAGDHADMILTLAYCGLRFGEFAALRVSSVDPARRRFAIEESVTEVNGQLVWSAPKDHQRRSVPYPDFLSAAISTRMAGKSPEDPLFPAPKGGFMRIGNARRDWFDPAVRAARLGGLTPHELRHTAASLAVSAGGSVLALQRMLGHDKPSTTLDVYSDLFDEDLDMVAEHMATARNRILADFLRT